MTSRRMLQKLQRDFAKIAKIYWLADRDTEQKKNLANSKRWFLRSEKLEAPVCSNTLEVSVGKPPQDSGTLLSSTSPLKNLRSKGAGVHRLVSSAGVLVKPVTV